MSLENVIDAYDVRVRQARGRLRLAECSRTQLVRLVLGRRLGQQHFLDRDVAAQHLVPGPPDAAHATDPDALTESIAPRDQEVRHFVSTAYTTMLSSYEPTRPLNVPPQVIKRSSASG